METIPVMTNTGNTPYPSALDIALASRPVGASKQRILAALTGLWNIHELEASDYLILSTSYRYINGMRLRNRIMSGTVTVEGITYAVIYHRTTPELCFRAERVRCSYRETEVGNFLLVQPVTIAVI
jgi:tRNA uridine 5-carbamoylmethylation protein Kti12